VGFLSTHLDLAAFLVEMEAEDRTRLAREEREAKEAADEAGSVLEGWEQEEEGR
jgi:hypothetical protein